MLIIKDGETIYKKVSGFRDFENKILADKDTPFALCSVTKHITAAAILQLEEKSKLSVKDKISKYIDWIPDYAKNVTIEQLIFHTGNIPNYIIDNPDYQLCTDKDWAEMQPFNTQYLKNFIYKTKPVSKVGSYSYSNTGYWLLGRIIEKVSDKSYAEYVKQNIFNKVGAKNSFIINNLTPYPEADAHLVWPIWRKLAQYYKTIGIESDADMGIFMPIGEIENYLKNMFVKNTIFDKKETYKKFLSKTNVKSFLGYYGYGLEQGGKYDKYYTISHSGGHNGYYSYLTYYPDQNLIIMFLASTATWSYPQILVNKEIIQCLVQ